MKLFGAVFLLFVIGEAFCYEDENFFNFAKNKITSDFNKSEGFVRDKCVVKLMKEAVKQFGSTYMFITDEHVHENLLHTLQTNFLHSYFTNPIHLSSSKSDTFDDLVIFRNKFQLKDVIKMKQPSQTTKFFVIVKNYKEVIQKFQILWESRLVNAVASYIENTTVYYYTYFPYTVNHCGGVGKPYLLARCNIITGIFSHREKLFPRKVYNLHKCPINISITENVPSSYYTERKKLTGWEVDLLNEILKQINGVPNYNIFPSKKRVYRTLKGYGQLVENSEIGSGMVVSLKGLVKTDFCMYGMSLCTTWIVPKKKGLKHSVDFLKKVFPQDVWLLLLLAYLFMAATIRLFFRVKCSNILFKLLPYLLGTTTSTKKTSRTLGAIWLWFCLIMNAVYQSGFQSTLLVPGPTQQLTTTKDVLESDLKILGVSDIITDAIPYFKERYNLSSRRFKNRKLSYEDWVYRMTIKKDSAYLGFRETVRYHIERTELASKIYVPENCVIKYLLAFVLKKNSHLTDIVVRFANRLNENGFLAFFINKHLSRESKQNIPERLTKILKPLPGGKCKEITTPINLDKILAVFMCFAGGISLALVAFILEFISTWNWRKIKGRIVTEFQPK